MVRQAAGYYNPASELLETGTAMTEASTDEPATAQPDIIRPVRRHHRRRHGAGVLHPADRRTTSAPRAPPLQLAAKMGLDPALVVHAKPMGPDFTFFVVYGRCTTSSTCDKVEVVEREFPLLTPKEVNAAIKRALRRKLVVVGACIGTDAHTVGIDAILNIKGFAGEKGLEYYRELKVVNLGAQVLVPDLVDRARAEKADAVLVCQVVTQRDAHLHNTTEMSAAFREAYPAGKVPLLVVGGPRFDESSAADARRRPHLRPGHDPRRGRALPRPRAGHAAARSPTREERSDDRDAEVGLTVTHRRYVPYCHAHYAGNLVDGAYSPRRCSATSPPRCASAPTATRGCSRPTPTSSSSPRSGPATSSRSTARAGAGRHAQPRDGLRGAASSAGARPDAVASRPPTCSTRPSWRPPRRGVVVVRRPVLSRAEQADRRRVHRPNGSRGRRRRVARTRRIRARCPPWQQVSTHCR